MYIWILALLLFAVAGACGYKMGAVRFGVSLVGLIVATALAMPLGPYLQRLVPMAGFKNPIWSVVLPPAAMFLLVYFIFIGISFFVHRKVELYFKYKADDNTRFGWERVNRAVGLWVGLIMGAAWLLLFGLVIYVAGYFTVQVSSDQTTTLYVRLLNQARQDLQGTGLDKAVAPFDPMPPRYYEASDILGLIYQNPILISRLSQYPPFLLMGDRPEFQELAKDADFNQMLLSKGDIVELIKQPKLQVILQNPEIVQELLGQDLKDLRAYLETGVSPRYQEEKILGKWKLDPYASMAQERKRHPDMTSTEMRQLKTVMTEIMPAVSITATTDNKLVLKAEGVGDKLRQLFQPPPPKVVANPQAQPNISPQMAQRYNLGRGQPRAAAPVAAPMAPPKPVNIPYMVLSAQGGWEHQGDKYQVKAQDEKSKAETLQVSAEDDRLTVNGPNTILVFAKAD
jgi:Colicin V production protein